ncbi:hypothetical protein ACLOJK_041769 [Asimina triloba]
MEDPPQPPKRQRHSSHYCAGVAHDPHYLATQTAKLITAGVLFLGFGQICTLPTGSATSEKKASPFPANRTLHVILRSGKICTLLTGKFIPIFGEPHATCHPQIRLNLHVADRICNSDMKIENVSMENLGKLHGWKICESPRRVFNVVLFRLQQ